MWFALHSAHDVKAGSGDDFGLTALSKTRRILILLLILHIGSNIVIPQCLLAQLLVDVQVICN